MALKPVYEVYLRNKLSYDTGKFREYLPDNDFVLVVSTDRPDVAKAYLHLGLSSVSWKYDPEKKLYFLLDSQRILGYIRIKRSILSRLFAKRDERWRQH